jgi:hypothetical protein
MINYSDSTKQEENRFKQEHSYVESEEKKRAKQTAANNVS